MKITRYEDQHFYYVWKPHGIPSTFGHKKSFLDILEASTKNQEVSFFQAQKTVRTKKEEYGLLNRLDNITAWLLYFAKTPQAKESYRIAQKNWNIQKKYLADVQGKFNTQEWIIDYPLGHHKFENEKMVVVRNANYENRIRGKVLRVSTERKLLYYDAENNISTVAVTIKKWARHQIRAHLASIGYPIIGDPIYSKQKNISLLHLRSVGLSLVENL